MVSRRVEGLGFALSLVAAIGATGARGEGSEIFVDGFESGDLCRWAGPAAIAGCPAITVTLPGDVDLTLVRVPAGTFLMGSPSSERGRNLDEGPQHQVTISRDYFVGKTEVTQEQWEALMGNNPSSLSGCPSCPVEMVTWYEAAAFANALSDHSGLERCYELTDCVGNPGEGMTCSEVTFAGLRCEAYRMPTEAEWERAARAATSTRFSHGDVLECDDQCGACAVHDQHMWWCGNDDPSGTQPVASKQPNGYGLSDMHGSVREWVWDNFGGYSSAPVIDPLGPSSGFVRIKRGGSWSSHARYCRSADRNYGFEGSRNPYLGLRLVRTANW